MALRRGFMAEATAQAYDVRADLGVGKFERLDPRLLAEDLCVPVWSLTGMAAEGQYIGHLVTTEPEVFSAATVFDGPRRTIVHNDGHTDVRQNSNLAHELSHALLNHPPTPALDDIGNRIWNQDIEDEAAWLAGCLLMTPEAALATARNRWTVAEASERFAISPQMVNFRINKTGARVRVARELGARR